MDTRVTVTNESGLGVEQELISFRTCILIYWDRDLPMVCGYDIDPRFNDSSR